MGVRAVLEVAPKRAFASALDWPGWARAGRTPEDALEALVAYGPRYAAVARRVRVAFDPPTDVRDIEIVEQLTGGGGTEFGVPGVASSTEDGLLPDAELKRLLSLLRATWWTLDAIAESAVGVELAKGPRGGGRDIDKILGHVREAEVAYLGKLGSKAPQAQEPHDAFVAAVTASARGTPVPNPNKVRTLWSPRYAVRRAAWHVLDHAWEIEDRSSTRVASSSS